MEIELRAAGEVAPPADSFVALRVGEVRKLARLEVPHKHVFPESACEELSGRVDVFKRIGSTLVQFGLSDERKVDVSVPCSEPGFDTVSLSLCVTRRGAEVTVSDAGKRERVCHEADEYLRRHNLVEDLASAMQVLLRDKPDAPQEFLSQRLLAACGARNTVSVETKPTRLPDPPCVGNFAAYYCHHFRAGVGLSLHRVHERFWPNPAEVPWAPQAQLAAARRAAAAAEEELRRHRSYSRRRIALLEARLLVIERKAAEQPHPGVLARTRSDSELRRTLLAEIAELSKERDRAAEMARMQEANSAAAASDGEGSAAWVVAELDAALAAARQEYMALEDNGSEPG